MSQELITALVGLGGVAIGSLLQWPLTIFVANSESNRQRNQLLVEFEQRQLFEWQSRFQTIMADLLAAVDPEVFPTPNKTVLVPLVLKAQLMLNDKLDSHGQVNSLINQLALSVNGWHGPSDTATVFKVQGQLLDAAKKIMYSPNR